MPNPAQPRPHRNAPSRRVVVVGAGLSGLVAAWRLQAAGHSVQVFDRRPVAGGRIQGERVDGFALDAALPMVTTFDRHLTGWIAEMGLADRMLPLRPAQLVQVTGGQVVPIDPQRLAGVGAIPGVSLRDRLRLLRWPRLYRRYRPLLDPMAPERAADLDFRSAADFARLYFGRTCFDRWVSPELTSVYGGDPAEISRVAALMHWARVGMLNERTATQGIPREGLTALVEEAIERLDVRTGVEVVGITAMEDGGFSLDCATRAGKRGQLEADVVVLSTAPQVAVDIAGDLLEPAERDHLESVAFAPSLTLSVAVSRSLAGMPQLVRVPRSEHHVIDVAVVEPGMPGGRAPVGGCVVALRASEPFTHANAQAADEVVEKGLLDALYRLHPDARGHVTATRMSRRAHAAPRFDVGAYRSLARFARVQVDRRECGRRLYFAGDHLIGPDAECAVISGIRAARDAISDVGANPTVD